MSLRFRKETPKIQIPSVTFLDHPIFEIYPPGALYWWEWWEFEKVEIL